MTTQIDLKAEALKVLAEMDTLIAARHIQADLLKQSRIELQNGLEAFLAGNPI